jgi:hypothetical protein
VVYIVARGPCRQALGLNREWVVVDLSLNPSTADKWGRKSLLPSLILPFVYTLMHRLSAHTRLDASLLLLPLFPRTRNVLLAW